MVDPLNLPPAGTIRAEVAQHLEANRNEIVEGWMSAVEADSQIPSADKLTFAALRDHFPQMLRELAEVIRYGGSEVEEDATTTGRAHAKARWKDGYRLDEVLRELSRVRGMVIQEIGNLVAGTEPAQVKPIIHDVTAFFGVIAGTSALEFCRAQADELRLRDRQLEDAYEAVRRPSREAEKIGASRLRLLRAVSHELRNAVQPVVLAASELQESTEWDPEADAELVRVSTKLQTLLSALARHSVLLAGQFQIVGTDFCLSDLMEYIEGRYKVAVLEKDLRFESYLLDPKPVHGDLPRMKEIADELVGNAIAYTASGAIVVVIATTGEDRWLLTVADTGRGLEPSLAEQVFGEFHIPPQGSGRGLRLGLVVSRHLAHLLGGELTFETAPNVGSTFRLDLPRDSRPMEK